MRNGAIREKVIKTVMVLADNNCTGAGSCGGIFVGGQIITQADNSCNEVINTVQRYQQQSAEPLLVSSDFENGCGSMIKGLTPLPYMLSLGAAHDENLAYDYGKATALEATTVGVNLSLSPIADLILNPKNPVLNGRAISNDPDIALPLLKKVIKGMQENGVGACIKHFPGDGTDYRDQHIVMTANDLSVANWLKYHGRVFGELIDDGVYSVMAGHLSFPAYQKKRIGGLCLPATLSCEILNDLLRGELGFKGAVISDGLGMGAFTGWYPTQVQSEIEAFRAGCDLMLWPSKGYVDAMVDAVESGYVPMEKLDKSAERISELKEKIGLYKKSEKKYDLTAKDKAYIKSVQQSVAEKSVTLVKDKNKFLPLDSKRIKKILLIPVTHHEPSYETARKFADKLASYGCSVDYRRERIISKEFREIADDYDAIIYALFTRSFRPIGPVDFFGREAEKLIASLSAAIEKTIIISFGSPYFEKQYFERADIFINAYSMLEPNVIATARALFGEVKFTSYTPINPAIDYKKIEFQNELGKTEGA